jgi:PAS domain S-box-containing protein
MRNDEALLLLRTDGTIAWVTDAAARLLGFPRDELLELALPGVGASDADAGESLGPIASGFRSVRNGDVAEADGEARLSDRNGRRVPVRWRIWALPNGTGDKQLLLSLAENASAIESANSGYREIFEHAIEGIFRSTIDGQLLEVNPAFAQMHGYANAAELITAVRDLNTQFYVRPERRGEFVEAMLEQGAVAGFESEVLRADGSAMWIAVFARTVRDERGEPLYFEGSVIDITERKEAEEERERSRTQLREFAERCQQVREEERMTVAREIHDELGQSLTLFKLDLAWLSGRIAKISSEETRQPLAEKLSSTEQLIDSTLKTVRRILAALRPPLLDECGLKDAIEFQVQEVAKRLGIRCEVDVEAVHGLPDSFSIAVFRIFQEILTNAAKHAKASRIKVTMRLVDGQVVMSVEDNGCGITKAKLLQAGRFGLMGIQERAVFMGGEVEIRGSPRSGTLVTLRVPIATEDTQE